MERKVKKLTSTIPLRPVKKRVAAYARVSNGKDASLQSLSAQISYYSQYIQQHSDWEYVGVYADEAITGTKDTRGQFMRLLSDCEAGRIDMVITKSISRFARNTVTLLDTVRKLKEKNVEVYFERENIYSMSGDGELMLTILASFAQEESRSVSDNCKWRIRKKFEEGQPTPFRIYGYDFVGNGLIINPAEAEIVRMVFTDYLLGMGKTAIIRKLSSLKVPTKTGGHWSVSSIMTMLQNEKYIGNLLLQKTFTENHLTKATKVNRGEFPMYYAEETHEPIIDLQTFEQVQKEIEKRSKQYYATRKSDAYEFTGKIRCGICGANFCKKTYNAGTEHARTVWSCNTYNKLGKAYCASKQIPENIIQEMATEVLILDRYDPCSFSEKIEGVLVPENGVLVFVFKDGSQIEHRWENISRRKSWSKEMKATARMKTLKYKGVE